MARTVLFSLSKICSFGFCLVEMGNGWTHCFSYIGNFLKYKKSANFLLKSIWEQGSCCSIKWVSTTIVSIWTYSIFKMLIMYRFVHSEEVIYTALKISGTQLLPVKSIHSFCWIKLGARRMIICRLPPLQCHPSQRLVSFFLRIAHPVVH